MNTKEYVLLCNKITGNAALIRAKGWDEAHGSLKLNWAEIARGLRRELLPLRKLMKPERYEWLGDT